AAIARRGFETQLLGTHGYQHRRAAEKLRRLRRLEHATHHANGGDAVVRAHELARDDVGRPDELVDEKRLRPVVDFSGRGHLLDRSARHHRDAVRHGQRLLLVVGDEDGGDAVRALQALDLDLHVEAQILVERAERLVEQQHLRIGGKAARERGALLLAAGELARLALGELAHVHQRKHLGHARADALARPLLPLEAVGDVLRHPHVREKRVIPEPQAGPAPARGQMVDGLAIEQHAALALADKAGHDAQQRGLAAARRPQQRDEFPARNIEIDVAHGDDLAEAMADVLKAQPVPAMRRHDPWWLSFDPGNSPSPDARGQCPPRLPLALAPSAPSLALSGYPLPETDVVGRQLSNALIFVAWMRTAYHGPVISFALASPH